MFGVDAWIRGSRTGLFQTTGGNGPGFPDDRDDGDGGDGGSDRTRSEPCISVSFIVVLAMWVAVATVVVNRVQRCLDRGILSGILCILVAVVVMVVVTAFLLVVFVLFTVYVCGGRRGVRQEEIA